MKNTIKIALTAIFILSSNLTAALDLSFATETKIDSTILKSQRNLLIKLPEGYSPKTSTYPVLYVLHGQWDTLSTVSTLDLLSNELPGFIVVGVVSQGMELRPVANKQSSFAKYLEKEVVPLVTKKYAVAPYKILSGHSNSGRFVINQWLANDHTFSAYYAFSPSLDEGDIIKKLTNASSESLVSKPPLTVTMANEEAHMQTPFEQLTATITKAHGKNQKTNFNHKKFPEQSHRTTKHASMQFALQTTFKGWEPSYETKISGLEALKKHYQNLTKRFGFSVKIPAGTLQKLTAYYATTDGDEAKTQLKQVIDHYVVKSGHDSEMLFEIADYLLNNDYGAAGKQVIAEICQVSSRVGKSSARCE